MNSTNIQYPWYNCGNRKHLLSTYHSQPPYYPLYAFLHLILIQLDEMGATIYPLLQMWILRLTEVKCLAKITHIINSKARTQKKACLT